MWMVDNHWLYVGRGSVLLKCALCVSAGGSVEARDLLCKPHPAPSWGGGQGVATLTDFDETIYQLTVVHDKVVVAYCYWCIACNVKSFHLTSRDGVKM